MIVYKINSYSAVMVTLPPVTDDVEHELEKSSSIENEDAPQVGQQATEYDEVESIASVSHTSVSKGSIRSRVDVVTEVTSEHVLSEQEEIVAQQEKPEEELESRVEEGQLLSGEEDDKQTIIATVDGTDEVVETKVERDDSVEEQVVEDQAVALSDSQDHQVVEASSYPALDHGDEDEEESGEEVLQKEKHPVSAGELETGDAVADRKHESLATEGEKDEEELSVSAEGQADSNQTSSKPKQESLAIEVN